MTDIVVTGGGFAGLWAALTASRELTQASEGHGVTLVSREPWLTVRPRLYETFSPSLRAPLEPVLAPLGIRFVAGEVASIDTAAKNIKVAGADGQTLAYARLVMATGSVQRTLDLAGANQFVHNIDTYAAAEKLDAHLRAVLDDPTRAGRLGFVVIGGGFTGIELATELRPRLAALSDAATAAAAHIVLLEQAAEIGPDLGANPRPAITAALDHAGVDVRTATRVSHIDAGGVVLDDDTRIEAATVVATTGLVANGASLLPAATHEADGRINVDDYLEVVGVRGVYAAGDLARAQCSPGHFALMSCQHAVPMGKAAGYNAARDLLGLEGRPYAQPDYVTCLDLGSWGAVFTNGWEREVQQSGTEVSALKRMINEQWIYPPTGDRDTILAAADIDAVWPPQD